MDDNLKIIQKFVEQYKDTLVLDYDKVVVLRGYSIDNSPETGDYYYIYQDLRGNFVESSCVGWCIPLKGFISEKEYDALKYHFTINLAKLNQEIK